MGRNIYAIKVNMYKTESPKLRGAGFVDARTYTLYNRNICTGTKEARLPYTLYNIVFDKRTDSPAKTNGACFPRKGSDGE